MLSSCLIITAFIGNIRLYAMRLIIGTIACLLPAGASVIHGRGVAIRPLCGGLCRRATRFGHASEPLSAYADDNKNGGNVKVAAINYSLNEIISISRCCGQDCR